MAFDNYTGEFLGMPETAAPSIAMAIDYDGDRPTPIVIPPAGDYTFNRDGRLVPIDAPDAVSYVVPLGMRVSMSEADPEDDPLEDEDDIEFEDEDDDEGDGDERCGHGKLLDEDCEECDLDDEDDEDDDEEDLDDLDDDEDLDEEIEDSISDDFDDDGVSIE